MHRQPTDGNNGRALLLCVVVERAKKCLDFGFTLFLLHLLACWTYEVRTLPPLPHVRAD